MELRISQPNVGNPNILYAHCPNCSRGYQVVDTEGKADSVPARCKRCDCPMDDERKAEDFMNVKAKADHDPALAALGRVTRDAMGLPSPEAAIIGADGE